ncbi:MAG: hypothetical protein WKF34_05320 [Pyrinomonadaceae bacterium]
MKVGLIYLSALVAASIGGGLVTPWEVRGVERGEPGFASPTPEPEKMSKSSTIDAGVAGKPVAVQAVGFGVSKPVSELPTAPLSGAESPCEINIRNTVPLKTARPKSVRRKKLGAGPRGGKL